MLNKNRGNKSIVKNIFIYFISFIVGFIISALVYRFIKIDVLSVIVLAFSTGIILGLFVRTNPFIHGTLITILIILFFVWLVKFTGMVKHPEFSGDYYKLFRKNWTIIFILVCPYFTFLGNKLKRKKSSG